MNSIEASISPDKSPPTQKEAKDTPALRLYQKDNEATTYTLHKEGDDFQRMMKEAVKLQEKGRDILLNEKDNPNIVHAKSNLHNNVNVGRVIEPTKNADNTFKRGVGQVVLASFFEKLSLDTRMPEALNPDKAKAADQPEPVMSAKQDQAQPDLTKASTKSEAMLQPGLDDTATGTESKVVLKKNGYTLPTSVLTAYNVTDGKFKDKATDALRFEDHGKKLSTPVEDRRVIADMIAVAGAKNWGTLELKGTETFRQIAWLEAESQGMQTTGYKPNERDLEQLAQLKQEREGKSIPAIEGAAKSVNTVVMVAEREKAPAQEAASALPNAKTTPESPAVTSAPTKTAATPDVTEPGSGARVETGRLVDHGPAKYNFDATEKESYYVKLETEKGERTVWGKDLERAMGEVNPKRGDALSLTLAGSKGVTVEANKRDNDGQVVGTETIAAQRNQWEVKPIELKITRELSKDEQMRVDAASKVLGKAIAKYPESERATILAKVSEAINKGTIELPTPKVVARSVEKPSPARSRDASKEQSRTR
jgi:hypothetical protein